MLLRDAPGLKKYKEVYAFVRDHVSMQFEEIRRLMQMRGFNFPVANLLCDLISGFSVTLFQPTNTKIGPGEAFKTFVESMFFPWDAADTAKEKQEKAAALYSYVRNPFAHSLGVNGKPGLQILIGKRKRPLTRRELTELEKSSVRPTWVKPALKGSNNNWTISVEGLYHGVFRLFWNVAQDANQMALADKRFAAKKFAWRKV